MYSLSPSTRTHLTVTLGFSEGKQNFQKGGEKVVIGWLALIEKPWSLGKGGLVEWRRVVLWILLLSNITVTEAKGLQFL